jgi:FKBP-type peptidyl-prolyl cis-trans isomerase
VRGVLVPVLVWSITAAFAADADAPPVSRAWADGPAPIPAEPVSEGLAVADVAPGSGDALAPGDLAVVAYVGWLDDGTIWDSTLDRRISGLPPGTARLLIGARRVPGVWSEGLAGMRVGGVRQLVLTEPDAQGEEPPRSLTVTFELVAAETPPEAVAQVSRASWPLGAYRAIDLQLGAGAPAGSGDRVTIDYVLRLPDGTVVDSSWRWPEPFVFDLGDPPRVRWAAAVHGMRVGGRRQVWIPAGEAFGGEGRPPLIPPDAPLVLTVDLRALGGG